MEFDGERRASLRASWREWGPYLQFEVSGSRGSLLVEHQPSGQTTRLRNDATETRTWATQDSADSSYRHELSAFLDALDSGEPPTPSGHAGVRVMETIDALYSSAQSGDRVRMRRAALGHQGCSDPKADA